MGRSQAERVSFLLSSLLILAIVGALLLEQLLGDEEEPLIQVEPRLSQVRQAGERYYLPVEIVNGGGKTAEDTRARVTLEAGDKEETAEFEIRFLAGGERTSAVVSFATDPRNGQLTAEVLSYLEP